MFKLVWKHTFKKLMYEILQNASTEAKWCVVLYLDLFLLNI